MQPKIMLFDEPTSALDPEMIKEVLEVMKELASSQQMTIVAITHELGFAREVADRIVMFDEGQIVEDLPPAEFFNNPRPRTGAALPVTDTLATALRSVWKSNTWQDIEQKILGRCRSDSAQNNGKLKQAEFR